MRPYVPLGDGLEPTDYDEYFDIPAETDKDLAARFYIKHIDPDKEPECARAEQRRELEAIRELLTLAERLDLPQAIKVTEPFTALMLQWVYDNRELFRGQGWQLRD